MPFGDNGQTVSAFESAIGAVAIGQPRAIQGTHSRQRFRIVNTNAHALGEHRVNEGQSRGFANVIGLRLECQPPNRQAFVFEGAAIMPADFGRQHLLLRLVDLVDCFNHLQGQPEGTPQMCQGADVLRKAAPAEAGAGK